VNDTARNQAVYINETGQHFDVVAEEYPGGPLVSCVQMADFTLIPPSTDPDALPVKALVGGIRDDGTPGVWEIHADDSIHLPQPEQTADNPTRCIIGGTMSTLPDGIQTRLGWSFSITGMNGRIIVGKAVSSHPVTIGGVTIAAGTPIGVYWRIYSLPASKFCIVSFPRIIGTFPPQPLPSRWLAHRQDLSDALRQLKLYLTGTLASYITSPFADGVRLEGPKSTGTDIVTGTDENGMQALARIDKNGNVTSIEEPDLELSALSVPDTSKTPLDYATGSLTVNVTLVNQSSFDARGVTLSYYVSTLDPAHFVLGDTTSTKSIPLANPNAFPQTLAASLDPVTGTISPKPATGTISQQIPISSLFTQTAGTTVTYYVYAFANADPTQNCKLDLSTSISGSFQVLAAAPTTSAPSVTLTGLTDLSAVSLTGPWSFNVVVTPAQATVSFIVTNDFTGAQSTPSLTYDPTSGTVSGTGASFDGLPGTHHVSVVAQNGAGTATSSGSVKIPVIYPEVVIDTYDPSDPLAPFDKFPSKMELWSSKLVNTVQVLDASLAFNDGGVMPYRAGLNRYGAYIDSTNNALGFLPGVYFLIVQASSAGDSFSYDIRVMTAPNSSYGGWTDLPLSTTGTTDSPLIATSGAAPTPSNTMEPNTSNNPSSTNHLSLFIPAKGVNWIKITLP
jgi:hypothetical protein